MHLAYWMLKKNSSKYRIHFVLFQATLAPVGKQTPPMGSCTKHEEAFPVAWTIALHIPTIALHCAFVLTMEKYNFMQNQQLLPNVVVLLEEKEPTELQIILKSRWLSRPVEYN